VRKKREYQFPIFPGVTFIEIPYWWDRKLESLAATIYTYRPDLFPQVPTGKPIPPSPYVDRIDTPLEKGTKHSQLTLTQDTDRKLMTATIWETKRDPTGW
jgi:hypothetical protein